MNCLQQSSLMPTSLSRNSDLPCLRHTPEEKCLVVNSYISMPPVVSHIISNT